MLQNPILTRKLRFFNIYLFTIYKVHPNPILFDIIKLYSTKSVFKIIWIASIELWEVYINFIWSWFGIGRHLLAFSINKRNQYGGRETLHSESNQPFWRISSHLLLSNQNFYGIIDWETTSSSWLTEASAK